MMRKLILALSLVVVLPGLAEAQKSSSPPFLGGNVPTRMTTAGITDSAGIDTTSAYKFNGSSFVQMKNGAAGFLMDQTIDPFVTTAANLQHQINLHLTPSGTRNTFENMMTFNMYYDDGGLAVTNTAEIVNFHVYSEVDHGTLSTHENFESSTSNYDHIGTSVGFLGIAHNFPAGTATNLFMFKSQLYNDNATAGAIANWAGLDCESKSGAGSTPTNNYCIRNGDPNGAIATLGRVSIGALPTPSSAQMLYVIGSDSTSATYPLLVDNSSSKHLVVARGDGGVGVDAATISAINATLFVSDLGGTGAFGAHIGVKQAAIPTLTNGALDAASSDVSGTITLSAANPVVTFSHSWATTPHCVVSSPSGTAFTYAATTTTLTLTGGANTNTATYICIQ